MAELIIFLILISLGYISGRMLETRHYRSIEAREREFLGLPAITLKDASAGRTVTKAKLVAGSVVISVDYFKRFLAGLRNFFGGRMSSYETLIDRARREAILRMKDKAKGADIIVNMRIETSSIAKGQKGSISTVEALAYGTALIYGPEIQSQPKADSSLTAEPPSLPAAEARYKVVFSGEFAPGFERETVQANIAALYKVSAERCSYMFTGQSIMIKENLTAQAAQKYKAAFEKTGAVCQVVEM
ncbi:hypothetical protein CSA56_13820 [candidate division KSB3 bacterium]|uniref:Uncharacterized protein n=1 Tax=candidate division KSB3 bacterium TaxID=2044937 RepID=A0A2G6KDH8_9BACT|nr:MAG: hypothetical protein CSA56_13820 [candidate division KSB3 bacterium]